MPGKHAPTSSKSFYISLGASFAGALAALGLVLALVLIALNAGSKDDKAGSPTLSAPPTTAPALTTTPTAKSTRSATPSVTAPANVRTAVLNGTSRTGLASRFAEEVRKAGYPVPHPPGNAPEQHAKSTIYYSSAARDEALAFQRRFPRFTVIAPMPPRGYPGDVMLAAVLGADYPG